MMRYLLLVGLFIGISTAQVFTQGCHGYSVSPASSTIAPGQPLEVTIQFNSPKRLYIGSAQWVPLASYKSVGGSYNFTQLVNHLTNYNWNRVVLYDHTHNTTIKLTEAKTSEDGESITVTFPGSSISTAATFSLVVSEMFIEISAPGSVPSIMPSSIVYTTPGTPTTIPNPPPIPNVSDLCFNLDFGTVYSETAHNPEESPQVSLIQCEGQSIGNEACEVYADVLVKGKTTFVLGSGTHQGFEYNFAPKNVSISANDTEVVIPISEVSYISPIYEEISVVPLFLHNLQQPSLREIVQMHLDAASEEPGYVPPEAKMFSNTLGEWYSAGGIVSVDATYIEETYSNADYTATITYIATGVEVQIIWAVYEPREQRRWFISYLAIDKSGLDCPVYSVRNSAVWGASIRHRININRDLSFGAFELGTSSSINRATTIQVDNVSFSITNTNFTSKLGVEAMMIDQDTNLLLQSSIFESHRLVVPDPYWDTQAVLGQATGATKWALVPKTLFGTEWGQLEMNQASFLAAATCSQPFRSGVVDLVGIMANSSNSLPANFHLFDMLTGYSADAKPRILLDQSNLRLTYDRRKSLPIVKLKIPVIIREPQVVIETLPSLSNLGTTNATLLVPLNNPGTDTATVVVSARCNSSIPFVTTTAPVFESTPRNAPLALQITDPDLNGLVWCNVTASINKRPLYSDVNKMANAMVSLPVYWGCFTAAAETFLGVDATEWQANPDNPFGELNPFNVTLEPEWTRLSRTLFRTYATATVTNPGTLSGSYGIRLQCDNFEVLESNDYIPIPPGQTQIFSMEILARGSVLEDDVAQCNLTVVLYRKPCWSPIGKKFSTLASVRAPYDICKLLSQPGEPFLFHNATFWNATTQSPPATTLPLSTSPWQPSTIRPGNFDAVVDGFLINGGDADGLFAAHAVCDTAAMVPSESSLQCTLLANGGTCKFKVVLTTNVTTAAVPTTTCVITTAIIQNIATKETCWSSKGKDFSRTAVFALPDPIPPSEPVEDGLITDTSVIVGAAVGGAAAGLALMTFVAVAIYLRKSKSINGKGRNRRRSRDNEVAMTPYPHFIQPHRPPPPPPTADGITVIHNDESLPREDMDILQAQFRKASESIYVTPPRLDERFAGPPPEPDSTMTPYGEDEDYSECEVEVEVADGYEDSEENDDPTPMTEITPPRPTSVITNSPDNIYNDV